MNELFKVFNHIAREIQVYFINGLLIIINILIVDFYYYDSSIFNLINKQELLIPLIIIIYIIGHVCMAFFYFLLEWKRFDKKLNTLLGFDYQINSTVLPKIYTKNREVYSHFIERYLLLAMMRWNMTSAFFISFLINLSYIIFNTYHWQLCLTTIICFLCSFFLYILTAKTEKDCAERIQLMIDNND